MSLTCAIGLATVAHVVQPPYIAEAVKIGEVTSTSAIVWVRLSAVESFDHEAFEMPPASGTVALTYGAVGDRPLFVDGWHDVTVERDGTHEFVLDALKPGTTYRYSVEATGEAGHAQQFGSFTTAPAADADVDTSFVVTTCHKWSTIEEPGEGQRIYESMMQLDPAFFVHTGDIVYYDQFEPKATSVDLARSYWHRMYSQTRHKDFHAKVPSYFIKDDHDLVKNDCWPGQKAGDLTFELGQAVFLEQVPMGDLTYRTIRWGKHLQIWLMEGRDYRSANKDDDGPGKTIWGAEQLAWLRRTLDESDATFRVVISPTPIVGPDRPGKNDNHSNAGFAHEGTLVRELLAGHERTYVVCGDRHWQYASKDDETGLLEYSCGSSTDAHAGGWGKNDTRPEHNFLRVAGGFLSVDVAASPPSIAFRLRDVAGVVVHEETHSVE